MVEISVSSKYNINYSVLFFAVLCSSMMGAQFLGISVNKIALIPLEVYLFVKVKHLIGLNKIQLKMLLWYIFTLFSCLLAFTVRTNLSGFTQKIFLYFSQIIIFYIPMLVLLNCMHDPMGNLKRPLIIIAKINSIWALIQFFCWYGFNFDFNDFIFNNVLNGIFGSYWTSWNYEAGSLALRVTGLNYDTAFFAVIIIFGFCLEDNKMWKTIFFLVCVLSLSRAGITTISLTYALMLLQRNKSKITANRILKVTSGFCLLCSLVFFIYYKVPFFQYQMNYMFVRFGNIFLSSNVGTLRHLMYIPLSIKVWLLDFSFFRKLLGIGPRVGGTAFILSPSTENTIMFSDNMLTNAWAVECDLAEIILGNGILGLFIYYILLKVFKTQEPEIQMCIFAICIMGVMYNVIETTIIQLFILCLIANNSKFKKVK